jgi:hypothetical protein
LGEFFRVLLRVFYLTGFSVGLFLFQTFLLNPPSDTRAFVWLRRFDAAACF